MKGEREGEKHQCVVAFLRPSTADCNPGTCPRLGIQLVTLWFAVLHSIHWATPAMADYTLETTGLINIHKIFYSAWPGGLDGWVVFQSSTKSLQVRSLHGDTKEAPCWCFSLTVLCVSPSLSPCLCFYMTSSLIVSKHTLRWRLKVNIYIRRYYQRL